jgi:hypothetical protein
LKNVRLVISIISFWLMLGLRGYSQVAPVLQDPLFTNNQFSFTLMGESKASYTILRSTDLMNWEPFNTNDAIASARTISAANQNQTEFFKIDPRPLPLFRFAILAQSSIDLSSHAILIDSFDSNDPTHSTDGNYDPLKAKDSGDVGGTSILNIGNGRIYGTVLCSSQSVIKVGPGGFIGTRAWGITHQYGLEPGHIRYGLNVGFRETVIPFAETDYRVLGEGPQIVNGTSYEDVFTGGNYRLSSFAISNAVLVSNTVSLWVPNGFSVSGTGRIDIAEGGKLSIFTGADSMLSGGGLRNPGDATKCIIYGLPGCDTIYIGGGNTYALCVYAPLARYDQSSSGTNFTDVVGAIVCKNAGIVGASRIHFDERLLRWTGD